MANRYLFRAKRRYNGEWVEGYHAIIGGKAVIIETEPGEFYDFNGDEMRSGRKVVEVIPDTICQCTGLKDIYGDLIFEDDVLRCHGNVQDMVRVMYGEFTVINAETLEKVDTVIGWHYEPIPTDEASKCEPFCLSMPLTDEYIKRCEMSVVCNANQFPKKFKRRQS